MINKSLVSYLNKIQQLIATLSLKLKAMSQLAVELSV